MKNIFKNMLWNNNFRPTESSEFFVVTKSDIVLRSWLTSFASIWSSDDDRERWETERLFNRCDCKSHNHFAYQALLFATQVQCFAANTATNSTTIDRRKSKEMFHVDWGILAFFSRKTFLAQRLINPTGENFRFDGHKVMFSIRFWRDTCNEEILMYENIF